MRETFLNSSLIEQQGLTELDVSELENLHLVREKLFESMEDLDPHDKADLEQLHLFVALLQSLEYDMQRVWKFDQDQSRHSWWYRVPHCNCPKMDNADPTYAGYRIYSGACELHRLEMLKPQPTLGDGTNESE